MKNNPVPAIEQTYKSIKTILEKAYQEKILDWVVKSMEFENEPVSMARLKELLKKEKTAPAR